MSEIKGVDSSVSHPSTSFTVTFPPSVTEQLAEQTPNYIPKAAQGGGVIADYQPKCDEVDIPADSGPDKFIPTVDYTVDQVVIPALAKLLAKMLATTDASLPNKDQKRGVNKIVREAFDEAYFRILRETYPDCQFGFSSNSYSLEPEPDKKPNVIL